ncbi:MAG: ABC transporter ATP-binding protein, partial [Pseudoflavonifractor sp.]
VADIIPGVLSIGELQKVLIARALAQEPDVLLMDEPTSSLDLKNQLEVAALIRRIASVRNITAVVTMHDLNLALRVADQFIFLREGGIFAAGDASIVSPANIRAVYGVDALVEHINGYPVVIPLSEQEGT